MSSIITKTLVSAVVKTGLKNKVTARVIRKAMLEAGVYFATTKVLGKVYAAIESFTKKENAQVPERVFTFERRQ